MNLVASTNWALFFGHFHILLLHLPIGLLLLLAVMEVLGRFKRFSGVLQARGVVLILAAASAVATVVCGWLLASAGGYSPTLLFWHRWLGTSVAALSVIALAAWLFRLQSLYYPAVAAGVLALLVAAHLGGSLTHGSNYLTEYAPAFVQRWLGQTPVTPQQAQSVADPEKLVVYLDIVAPVFTQDCISCHGADKQKGGLRLDSFAFLAHGGHDGAVIIAGKPENSLLIQRLLLPKGNEHRMPPAGKPRPTADQIELLRWWIANGAKPAVRVGDLPEPSGVADILDKLYPATGEAKALARGMILPLMRALAVKTHVVMRTESAKSRWIDANASLNPTFGDAELAELLPLAGNIRSLNLARTKVRDAGMQSVGKMTNLTSLTLDHTAVTDAGLAHLTTLRKLNYLNLYADTITDAGLKSLGRMPRLTHLYLWRTKVTPAAAAGFAAQMTDHDEINRWQSRIDALKRDILEAQVRVVLGGGIATKVAVASSPAKPINMFCPNSGRPINPAITLMYQGKLIGFCTDHCKKLFIKNPAPFLAKLGLQPPKAKPGKKTLQ